MFKALPGAYPLSVSLEFRVQSYDIDFAGHVNNIVYVRWLEDLRMELLRLYSPLPELAARNTLPILASTHITYHRPIHLFDIPRGRMHVSVMGRATLTLVAGIAVNDTLCASATQRGALLDMQTLKPVRFPRELVDAFHVQNAAPAG